MSLYLTGNTTSPKQAVILLHGYGASGQDLIDLGDEWTQDFPDTIFIAPDAPNRCEISPMGYQWFSLADWSPLSLSAGAKRAAPWLDDFIQQQMAHYQIPPERLVLAGFSQGTMMALYMGLRIKPRIAGVLGYSGALVCTEEWSSIDVQKPPITLVHGMADTVVPVAAYYHAMSILESHGFAVDGHPLHGLMHGINQYGLEIGRSALAKMLTSALVG
jgi:phospholipase/carboxylesterase